MDAFPTDEKSYAQLQVDSHSQRIGIVVDIPQEPKATHIWVYAYKTLQEEKSVYAHKVFYKKINTSFSLCPFLFFGGNTLTMVSVKRNRLYSFQIGKQQQLQEDRFWDTFEQACSKINSGSLKTGTCWYTPEPRASTIVVEVYSVDTGHNIKKWNFVLYDVKERTARFAFKEFQSNSTGPTVTSCVAHIEENVLFFLMRPKRKAPWQAMYVDLQEGIPKKMRGKDGLFDDDCLPGNICRIVRAGDKLIVACEDGQCYVPMIRPRSRFRERGKE